MMTTHDDATRAGLLAAILAHPDDDDRRLVYADWLDDCGEVERAEFIRVGCELANHPCGDEGRRAALGSACHCEQVEPGFHCLPCLDLARKEIALWQRERELLCPVNFWGWFGDYLGPMWPGSTGVNFAGSVAEVGYFCPGSKPRWRLTLERGFIEAVTLPADDWLRHADAVLACHPVRRVTLTTEPGVECVFFRGRLTGYRLSGRSRSHAEHELEDVSDYEATRLSLLKAEWPGVEFTLPAT
jgi:uncharacterized protein (TIGR02996 family)